MAAEAYVAASTRKLRATIVAAEDVTALSALRLLDNILDPSGASYHATSRHRSHRWGESRGCRFILLSRAARRLTPLPHDRPERRYPRLGMRRT